jgi:hypothetical protein
MDFHPLANDYPLMPAYELGRIEQSMIDRGFDPRFPIVTYEGMILDGRNRWIASCHANVKPKLVEFKGTEDEARLFVQTANEERRHLSPEWLKARRDERVGRVAEKRKEGKSLRTIAEEEGVSKSQIERDLDEAKSTVPGGTVEPADGKVKGRDGKERPAKKADPDESPTDAEDTPIPEKALPAFAAAKDIEAVCRDLDALLKRVEELAKGPGGALIRVESVRQQLKDAKGNLWANRPTHVCPYCHGEADDCKCCKGRGWTAKHIYEQAPGSREKKKGK